MRCVFIARKKVATPWYSERYSLLLATRFVRCITSFERKFFGEDVIKNVDNNVIYRNLWKRI